MSHVTLITTGGTIASLPTASAGVVAAGLDGARLLGAAPPVPLRHDAFCAVGSYQMDLALAWGLARRINAHLADADCLGAVVAHGTDTMEESAFLADLLLAGDKPVVFTGAQHHAGESGGDGPRNLADAITLAAAPVARGLGAMILFDQDFHAARDVYKSHTSRLDTFTSGDHGKLGSLDGTRVRLSRRPSRRLRLDAPAPLDIPLLRMAMGMNGDLIRHLAGGPAPALVIEGFGRGNVPADAGAAIREAIDLGKTVAIASRCPSGAVAPTYGGAGGGADLAAAGALFAGDLAGNKARILLGLLQAMPIDEAARRASFAALAD